jgi:DNA polymerase-1
MLAEGKNAWLALVGKDGRMHGRVNTIGAATTRCTHSSPNMAQIPSVRKPFGAECRELFYAPKGYKQVGADLNAIELRCFAHYLSTYDNGAYSTLITTGDIHWANALAAGFYPKNGKQYDEHDKEMKAARTNAKTLIYALLYGAGDSKIGQIVGGGTKEGKKIRTTLYKNFPAIQQLTDDVKSAAERNGSIKLLHGARIPIRKAFAALNTLLQGAGAVVAKEWLNEIERTMSGKGWVYGKDYWFAAHVHDECQSIVREELAEEFSELVTMSSLSAGNKLGMRCPVASEAKIGNNWADCH